MGVDAALTGPTIVVENAKSNATVKCARCTLGLSKKRSYSVPNDANCASIGTLHYERFMNGRYVMPAKRFLPGKRQPPNA
jgi:hypothetical protein